MRLNVIEVQMIVTIGVCVILPVLIVWIVGRVRQNATNRKAEIILKAMEQQGAEFNPDLIKPLLQKKSRSREISLKSLMEPASPE